MLETLKYLIQPVAIERDENGRILREVPGETKSAYSLEQIQQLVAEFEQAIVNANQGGEDAGQRSNGVADQLRQPSVPR